MFSNEADGTGHAPAIARREPEIVKRHTESLSRGEILCTTWKPKKQSYNASGSSKQGVETPWLASI